MNKFYQIGAVIAGYIAAPLLAFAITYILTHLRPVQDPGGMAAFGDLLLFLGFLGFFSLIPTGLALYLLRPYEKFWTFFSIAALIVAATGPFSAMTNLIYKFTGPNIQFLTFNRVLGTPLFCFGFLLSALFAPFSRPRKLLLAAAAIEFAVIAYAIFCLVIFHHWLL